MTILSGVDKRLNRLLNIDPLPKLHRIGASGVDELSKNTPKDTGEAAASWRYEVNGASDGYTVSWCNDDMAGKVPLVILLEYGHATRSGSYVPGRNFIEPSISPIYADFRTFINREIQK